MIQLELPDLPRRIESAWVRQHFLAEPDAYIREMSSGSACLMGELTRRWYRLPGTMKDYWVPWQNLKVDKSNLRRLVADALARVEQETDLTQYDFLIMVLAATAREWGNQGLNTYPGILGWKDERALQTPSGKKIRGGIAVYAQSANLAKIFHNIAHIMGGVANGRRVLPDMYDQDTASGSHDKFGPGVLATLVRAQMHMGAWDPMSCNMCPRLPGAPGITSWTRMKLGWLRSDEVHVVSQKGTSKVRLGPLADPGAAVRAIRIPLTASTYYLVENRQKIGMDRNAPGTGVLIMLADDDVPEPRFGRAPVRLVNADPAKPYLDGAAFEVGAKSVFTDDAHGVVVRLLAKTGNSYDIAVERTR